ncbi:MAG: hypothetical protein HRT63_11925 [Erythrobacter sp.]|nr:hypothetical protein [Erythrobacter sp.]
MRLFTSVMFFASFGLWLAAETYVGLTDPELIVYQTVFVVVLVMHCASAWGSLQQRRLEWQLPLISVVSVIGMQLVWRDLIHGGKNFKLYAGLITDALPVIVVFGLVAMFLELRYIARKQA